MYWNASLYFKCSSVWEIVITHIFCIFWMHQAGPLNPHHTFWRSLLGKTSYVKIFSTIVIVIWWRVSDEWFIKVFTDHVCYVLATFASAVVATIRALESRFPANTLLVQPSLQLEKNVFCRAWWAGGAIFDWGMRLCILRSETQSGKFFSFFSYFCTWNIITQKINNHIWRIWSEVEKNTGK